MLCSLRTDEGLASKLVGSVLVTAPSRTLVVESARRVHDASRSASGPFVTFPARDLPSTGAALRHVCVSLLAEASGGTLLITDIDELSVVGQTMFAGLLEQRLRSAEVRIMTGTTVSLLDRVAAGRFDERLFYRLNMVHILWASAQA